MPDFIDGYTYTLALFGAGLAVGVFLAALVWALQAIAKT